MEFRTIGHNRTDSPGSRKNVRLSMRGLLTSIRVQSMYLNVLSHINHGQLN